MQEFEFDPCSMQPFLDEDIESRTELIASVIERLMAQVRSQPCAKEHLDEVQMALTEALSNAVIHGNREDPSKRVHIWGCCAGDEHLLLAVTDEGEGFDPDAIPDPTVAENIFSEHGRGIFLMNCLMDRAEHRLGGRQVVLKKRVSNAQNRDR